MHDYSKLKKPYKMVVVTAFYFACIIFLALSFTILNHIDLPDISFALNIKSLLFIAFLIIGTVSALMLALLISAFIAAVCLKLKNSSPLFLSLWAVFSWRFPKAWLEDDVEQQNAELNYRKIVIVIAVQGILIVFLVGGYDALESRPVLERGSQCLNSSYPINVNMVFDEIAASDALFLLAGFSCNEFRYKNLSQDPMSLNYIDEPWDEVVRKICNRRNMECWTEEDVLYAIGK